MREQGSGTRRLCEVYLASHQLRPPLLTLGSNGAIKSAARMGLGIALQSRAAVGLELGLGPPCDDPPARRAAKASVARRQVHGRARLGAGRGVRRATCASPREALAPRSATG